MTIEEQREIQNFVYTHLRLRNVGEYIGPMIERVLSTGEDFGPFDYDDVLGVLCPSLCDLTDADLKDLAEGHDIDLQDLASENDCEVDLTDDTFRDALIDRMEREGIEPEQREVYEWYILDTYWARKLAEIGEVVLNDDLWGRCCTGQSVILDPCIEALYRAHKAPRE